MPKVSVIIPVYNVEKYLRQCLDSVINQTLKNIEIICVNDCSTDNSLSILKEYAQKDNRIKIIEQKENKGQGVARNIALDVAQGRYIMFLDSDDWLEPNACETAYKQISQNNNDFVIFNYYSHFENIGKKFIRNIVKNLFEDCIGKNTVNPMIISKPFFYNTQCWFEIYNTQFLIKNNIYFDQGYCEDLIFNTKIFTSANSISVIEDCLYNCRQRQDSSSKDVKIWNILIEKKLNIYNSLIKNNSKYILNYVISSIISTRGTYKRFIKIEPNTKEIYYTNLHKMYKLFHANHNLKNFSDFFDYKIYKLIIENNNYLKFKFAEFLKIKLFSIRRIENNKLIINILGIKISHNIKNTSQTLAITERENNKPNGL